MKCYLFNSYCTGNNVLLYKLWFNSTKGSLKKLRTSYKSSIRRFLVISKPYSASQMFVSPGILTIDEMLRKSIYRFVERIENSTNSIILFFTLHYLYIYIYIYIYIYYIFFTCIWTFVYNKLFIIIITILTSNMGTIYSSFFLLFFRKKLPIVVVRDVCSFVCVNNFFSR